MGGPGPRADGQMLRGRTAYATRPVTQSDGSCHRAWAGPLLPAGQPGSRHRLHREPPGGTGRAHGPQPPAPPPGVYPTAPRAPRRWPLLKARQGGGCLREPGHIPMAPTEPTPHVPIRDHCQHTRLRGKGKKQVTACTTVTRYMFPFYSRHPTRNRGGKRMKNSLYVSLCLLNFLHVNNANSSLHMNYAEQVNLDREQRGGSGGWERGAEGKQQLYGGQGLLWGDEMFGN